MRRRDFTVNAMARRLETGELVDPLDGRADLEARRLRTVSPQSFREDPLRLVRALRFVSQLGFEPDEELLAQMREEAPAVKLVSGERIGGGLAADGMGELSKLLLGAEPAPRAAARARHRRPRRAPARVRPGDRLRPGEPLPRPHGRRAHVRRRAGRRRPRASRCPCGSRRSSTTSASRSSAGAGTTAGSTTTRSPASPPTGTTRSAQTSPAARCSGSAIRTRCRKRVVRIVRRHMFQPGKGDARRARRFLRRNGDELAFDLLDHKHADLLGKRGTDGEPPPLAEIERLARFRAVVEQERSSPHRLARPRGRRQRPDRARLPARAAARPHPPRAPRRGRRRARRSTRATQLLARAKERRVIRWEVDGYVVAFTTRVGGVSEGPYASLNLGRKSGDDPERADENRRHRVRRARRRRRTSSRSTTRCTPTACSRRCRAARRARGRTLDGRAGPADPRDVRRLPADRARARGRGRARRRRPPRRLERAARRHRRGGRRTRSAAARSRPRSARRSARAATRWGRRSRRRSASASATTSCATAASTSGRAPSARFAPPESSASTASTAAPPASPRRSSRTAATPVDTGRQGVIAYVAG